MMIDEAFDEFSSILNRAGPDRARLLDTGHAVAAGFDYGKLIDRFGDRIRHSLLKAFDGLPSPSMHLDNAGPTAMINSGYQCSGQAEAHISRRRVRRRRCDHTQHVSRLEHGLGRGDEGGVSAAAARCLVAALVPSRRLSRSVSAVAAVPALPLLPARSAARRMQRAASGRPVFRVGDSGALVALQVTTCRPRASRSDKPLSSIAVMKAEKSSPCELIRSFA